MYMVVQISGHQIEPIFNIYFRNLKRAIEVKNDWNRDYGKKHRRLARVVEVNITMQEMRW